MGGVGVWGNLIDASQQASGMRQNL